MTRATLLKPQHHLQPLPYPTDELATFQQDTDQMSTGEDDDIKLQRAAASLIANFARLLPHLLRKRKHGLVPVKLMHKACSLVNLFTYDEITTPNVT